MSSATCDYLNIPQGTTMRDLLKGVAIGGGMTQVFTSSCAWNKPANLLSAFVEVWGAGGSGGNGLTRGGGGGGSGYYASKTFSDSEIPSQVNITIGMSNTKSNGSPSSFGSLLSASGGEKGGDYYQTGSFQEGYVDHPGAGGAGKNPGDSGSSSGGGAGGSGILGRANGGNQSGNRVASSGALAGGGGGGGTRPSNSNGYFPYMSGRRGGDGVVIVTMKFRSV